jgi:hypothetical protein
MMQIRRRTDYYKINIRKGRDFFEVTYVGNGELRRNSFSILEFTARDTHDSRTVNICKDWRLR